MNIIQQISKEDKSYIKSFKNIAVAVSGGSDSMALAIAAKEIIADESSNLIALTVDHKLRDESKNEAIQAGKWLNKCGINHHVLAWNGEKKQSNIQSEARNARYKLLTDYCHASGIDLLLIGHNSEDQAETVLMRLMRGSGVDGIAGVSARTVAHGINILRPFLKIKKQQIKEFLTTMGQNWIEDPSNLNEKYARVVARNFINQAADKDLLVDRLVETAENMSQSKSYIESKIAEDMQRAVKIYAEGYVVIDAEVFKLLHVEAAYKILSKIVQAVGGSYYKPRFEKLKNLYQKIYKNNLAGGVTLGGCSIWQANEKNAENLIYISREVADIIPEQLLYVSNSPNKFVWDGRFICEISPDKNYENMTISHLQNEDFKQLAELGTAIKGNSLKKKILYSLPCIKHGNKIVSVPHLGFSKNNKYCDLIKIKFRFNG